MTSFINWKMKIIDNFYLIILVLADFWVVSSLKYQMQFKVTPFELI